MKDILQIYKYTFAYRTRAILVIVCNLLFVIFNLLSLVLFIPFLQLIFNSKQEQIELIEPEWSGKMTDLIIYLKDSYNYFMQEMVNNNPKQALLFVCISVFLAFFLKNLFRYGAVWHQSELRMAVVRDLRNKLFHKALNLPLSFYTNERKGDLMSRMNSDVGEIEIAVVAILELIYRDPIAIIINVATLIYLSPKLTLISFVLLPVSAFVISRIGKSLKKTAKSGQEQMGLLFSNIDEGLGGIRIIKAFNAIDQIYSAFQRVNLRHQQLITKTFRKKDLSPILNETLGAGVMLCLVWFGGSMILDINHSQELTGEVFITFIIVFSQLLRPIQGISTNLAFMNKAKASQDRINEILDTDEKIYEVENPVALSELKSGIRYENVSFRYKDEPITQCSIHDLRNHIGIVSQESILFNASVKENIAFGMPNATMDEIIEAGKIANAHDFISALENGYETNIGERGSKLSGGQKQRISIARAVLKNPTILILDEATSALDTESEKVVQEALDHLMRDRTTIIIAHRLSTIINADEIVLLSKGEIKERGNHKELMALKGMYYNLCSLQGIQS